MIVCSVAGLFWLSLVSRLGRACAALKATLTFALIPHLDILNIVSQSEPPRPSHTTLRQNITLIDAMASNASFPMFPDGDVKVVVNPDQQYQLHSNVLKHASPILRSLLADKYAAQLGKKAQRDGIVVRHKLVLINNPSIYDDDDSNPHVPYVFTRVKLDSMGRPVPGSPQGVGFDPDNGRRAPPAFKAFNTIIAALYNQKISLGDPFTDGIAELLENAFQATQIAEYFDCVRTRTFYPLALHTNSILGPCRQPHHRIDAAGGRTAPVRIYL